MYRLDRIVITPGVVGGMPRIKGTRVTVGAVLGQLAAGHSVEDVLKDYPYIERDDVLQAISACRSCGSEAEVID